MNKRLLTLSLITVLLPACSSNWKAPYESRSRQTTSGPAPVFSAEESPANAGKSKSKQSTSSSAGVQPGENPQPASDEQEKKLTGNSYRVQQGDTLYGISQRSGVTVQNLIDLNDLSEPYILGIGQQLRIGNESEKLKNVTQVSTNSRYSDPQTKNSKTETSETVEQTVAKPPVPANKETEQKSVDGLKWQWPVRGKVIQKFSPSNPSKRGIKIAGQAGTAVVATESGEVVYSGNGLVGYGELIIIKHNSRYLSAYGHNQKRLVKEGDRVKRGGTIATMGQLKGKALLHFEIRRNGKPVDPSSFLP
jgi:lipoprotein NlpD